MNIAGKLFQKKQIKVGVCIPRSVFVQDSVLGKQCQKNWNSNVSIVVRFFIVPQVTVTKINIVHGNVGI